MKLTRFLGAKVVSNAKEWDIGQGWEPLIKECEGRGGRAIKVGIHGKTSWHSDLPPSPDISKDVLMPAEWAYKDAGTPPVRLICSEDVYIFFESDWTGSLQLIVGGRQHLVSASLLKIERCVHSPVIYEKPSPKIPRIIRPGYPSYELPERTPVPPPVCSFITGEEFHQDFITEQWGYHVFYASFYTNRFDHEKVLRWTAMRVEVGMVTIEFTKKGDRDAKSVYTLTFNLPMNEI